jgi:hypothetical protein
MRDLLVFCVVAAVVFFGVGEWRGWYLGIPSQTPLVVYKKSHVATATRRTINLDYLPLDVSGDVQDGSVTVVVYHERPFSYQTSRAARPETKVFERSYAKGQRIAINEPVSQGPGIYRVQFEFEDATGFFRLKLPTGAEL